MALGPRLDLRQSQSLVMTPQLQQAIKLLALSNVEIEAFLQDALEANPLLSTRSGDSDGPLPSAETPPEQAEGEPDVERGTPSVVDPGAGTIADPLDKDTVAERFIDDSPSDLPELGSSGTRDPSSDELFDLDRFAAPEPTLEEHLAGQARTRFEGRGLAILLTLIDQVEPTGYLPDDHAELLERMGAAGDEIAQAIADLQSLDPAGIGARNLSECMALQAKAADRYDPAMARLIDNLDLVAKGALPQLRRLCRVDDEDLHDMIAELRDYDPKPGCAFAQEEQGAITPDIFVRESGKGWVVELNRDTLPRLVIDRDYRAELESSGLNGESRAWLNSCATDANWLVRALDQRQRTITKVASEIVKQQAGFFREGVSKLRPLTLQQVADAIDMHESTVSRATSAKYLSCERGTFELKFFFTSAIQSADGGEAVSASAVKAAIKTLIDQEDAKKILSDDKLVAMLKDQGFDIARRTVAKYREAMGLGSSVERRRQKRLAG